MRFCLAQFAALRSLPSTKAPWIPDQQSLLMLNIPQFHGRVPRWSRPETSMNFFRAPTRAATVSLQQACSDMGIGWNRSIPIGPKVGRRTFQQIDYFLDFGMWTAGVPRTLDPNRHIIVSQGEHSKMGQFAEFHGWTPLPQSQLHSLRTGENSWGYGKGWTDLRCSWELNCAVVNSLHG